jgi:hypothetical protein
LDLEQLISLEEAATRYAISSSHLRLLACTGLLQVRRVGHAWFTTPDAVAAYPSSSHLGSKSPRQYQRS